MQSTDPQIGSDLPLNFNPMADNQSPAEQVAALVELIVRRIYLIRRQRVMLDTHLAELYGVPTFRLNEAVKRNSNRFPEDFLFQLTAEAWTMLAEQVEALAATHGNQAPATAALLQSAA